MHKLKNKQKQSLQRMKTPSPPPSSSFSLIRKARLSPYLFTILAFMAFVAVLYGEDFFSQQLQQSLDRDQRISKAGEFG